MKQIPLAVTANQRLSVIVDGATWTMHIFQSVNVMCMDLSRNGTSLINGLYLPCQRPVLPYLWMRIRESGAGLYGNFFFDSISGSTDWTDFGGDCKLWYLDESEVATWYRNRQAILVAGDMSNGAYPRLATIMEL